MFRLLSLLAIVLLSCGSGCALIPDVMHEPQYHNPFPQLYRVAVLPFGNQSKEPTVDGEQMALAYFNELQLIRGFEVMPVPVAKRMLEATQFEPRNASDFQKLARFMGVDAVVVGSVTEFTPYYPPRMGMAVNWYAANPNFHPIPAGYGLPWGTPHESDIPEELLFDAEFALAREQLATQTPEVAAEAPQAERAAHQSPAALPTPVALPMPAKSAENPGGDSASPGPATTTSGDEIAIVALPPEKPVLPENWPDPRGFIPPPPSLTRPAGLPQADPVMTLTKVYNGADADFTSKLEKYYYFRNDARFGGWQSYLQRSDDFTRFCCHLHITEMLAARGGCGKPKVVYRWPISRYER